MDDIQSKIDAAIPQEIKDKVNNAPEQVKMEALLQTFKIAFPESGGVILKIDQEQEGSERTERVAVSTNVERSHLIHVFGHLQSDISKQENQDAPEGGREAAYDQHISPLMTQIIDLCRQHKIQMVCSFDITEPGAGKEGQQFCTSTLIDPEYGPTTREFKVASAVILGELPPALGALAAYVQGVVKEG